MRLSTIKDLLIRSQCCGTAGLANRGQRENLDMYAKCIPTRSLSANQVIIIHRRSFNYLQKTHIVT